MNVDFKKIQINEFDIPLVLVGVLEEAKGDVFISDINEEAGNVVELGDFKGKNGDLSLIYTKGTISPKRLLLIGLGKQEKLTVETVREAVGDASRKARDLDVKKLGIYLDSFARDKLELTETTEALVQGIIMGSFQNIVYRTKNLDKYKKIEELIIFSPDADEIVLKQGIESGKIIADAVNFCRELAWGPANYITPTKLANEALRLEKDLGIKTTVFEREQAKEIGLTSFLAVAQGTKEPPKFIIMEHGANKEGVETVALIAVMLYL